MPIFEKIQHGADLAKFKANQLLRINRVQSEISGLRREIQAVREKVINTTLSLHQKGMLALPELEDLCLTIDKYKAEIIDKEALIESIRAEALDKQVVSIPASQPVNPCPKCNYDIPLGAVFCPNCGLELANMPRVPEPPIVDLGKCSSCGADLPSDSEFCPNCGKRISSPEQGG